MGNCGQLTGFYQVKTFEFKSIFESTILNKAIQKSIKSEATTLSQNLNFFIGFYQKPRNPH